MYPRVDYIRLIIGVQMHNVKLFIWVRYKAHIEKTRVLAAMTQRRVFGHGEFMVGRTHMSQNGTICQRCMQETCNITNYTCKYNIYIYIHIHYIYIYACMYVDMYTHIWMQSIKLETFGTMMLRRLDTLIGVSPGSPSFTLAHSHSSRVQVSIEGLKVPAAGRIETSSRLCSAANGECGRLWWTKELWSN